MLTMNYWPEATAIGPYVTELAQYLQSHGWDVDVVTTFPHYPQWQWQQPPRFPWADCERAGVRIRRVPVILARGGLLSRLLYDFSFPLIATVASMFLRAPDVILCVSPPLATSLAGRCIAVRRRARTIVNVEDLPVAAARSVGLLSNQLLVRLGETFERISYRLANVVVVITDRFRPHVAMSVRDDRRIVTIPHWAPDSYEDLSAQQSAAMRRELDIGPGEFVLIHIGNIGNKQDLETPIRAIGTAAGTPSVRFFITGTGSEAQRVESLATLSDGRVQVMGLLHAGELDKYLQISDVAVISEAPGVGTSVAPSKLLRYMAAAKPVLAAVSNDSVAAEAVRRSGCGLVVPPGSIDALATAIASLSAMPTAERRAMGRRGQDYVRLYHSQGRVLEAWDELLRVVLHDSDGSPGGSLPPRRVAAPTLPRQTSDEECN